MDWLGFIASIVGSLAWPSAVVIVGAVFRRQIRDLLSTGLQRVKAGPFEAEWHRAQSQLPEPIRLQALEQKPDSVEAAGAEVSPQVAILTRFAELESQLIDAIEAKRGTLPRRQSFGQLIDLALQEGLIDAVTANALTGVTVMRNLAAHGRPVTSQQAREFVALADAAEFALRYWLSKGQGAKE